MYQKMKKLNNIFFLTDSIPIITFSVTFLLCTIVMVFLMFYFGYWPNAFYLSDAVSQIGLLIMLSSVLTSALLVGLILIYGFIFFVVCVIEANKKDQEPNQ